MISKLLGSGVTHFFYAQLSTAVKPSMAGFVKHTEDKLCPFLIPAGSATFSSQRVGNKTMACGFLGVFVPGRELSWSRVPQESHTRSKEKTQQPLLLQSASEWKPKGAVLNCSIRSDELQSRRSVKEKKNLTLTVSPLKA